MGNPIECASQQTVRRKEEGGNLRDENKQEGTSLVIQWLRLCLPTQGMQVQSLVREQRPHMPLSQKKLENKTHKTEVIL